MKPQLVIQDLHAIGRHNGDLGKTSARLKKAAAWKKQRIVMVIPTAETIPVLAVSKQDTARHHPTLLKYPRECM